MDSSDWILIISAGVVVLGWFVNSELNRRHEMAKKRMEYRLDALHSFLPVLFSMQKYENPFIDDPELLGNLEKARSNFQLYGLSDEIDIFENMVKALEKKDVSIFNKKMSELISLVRKRIRAEVGLNA